MIDLIQLQLDNQLAIFDKYRQQKQESYQKAIVLERMQQEINNLKARHDKGKKDRQRR